LPVIEIDSDPNRNVGCTDLSGELGSVPAPPETDPTPVVTRPGAGPSSAMVTRPRARGGRGIWPTVWIWVYFYYRHYYCQHFIRLLYPGRYPITVVDHYRGSTENVQKIGGRRWKVVDKSAAGCVLHHW